MIPSSSTSFRILTYSNKWHPMTCQSISYDRRYMTDDVGWLQPFSYDCYRPCALVWPLSSLQWNTPTQNTPTFFIRLVVCIV